MTVIDAQRRLAPSRTTVEDFGPALIAVCVILVIAATSVPSFYGSSNLNGIAPQLAALATLSIGQMLVLLVRGIDLSVSAVIGVTGVVFATDSFGSDLERLAIVILVATATGLTNGLLVTKRGVPPFIATFGTLMFLGGIRIAYTQGQTSGTAPNWMTQLSVEKVWFVPWSIVLLIGVAVICGIILNHTHLGRWVHAIGANPGAARYSGLRVDTVTIGCYVACSLLAVVAGVLMAGFAGYVDFTLGANANLDAIAGAVIGGVAFSGGRGKLTGAVAGAFVVLAIQNLLVLSDVAIQWRYVLEGIVLIGAVKVQSLRQPSRV
jgi:ribose/xylose/arabinose/galactoside ABC-type transport system permease subunit